MQKVKCRRQASFFRTIMLCPYMSFFSRALGNVHRHRYTLTRILVSNGTVYCILYTLYCILLYILYSIKEERGEERGSQRREHSSSTAEAESFMVVVANCFCSARVFTAPWFVLALPDRVHVTAGMVWYPLLCY